MNGQAANSTAKLATAFGLLLMLTDNEGKMATPIDPKTARELSVLSRILEKRLVDTRRILAMAIAVEPESISAR